MAVRVMCMQEMARGVAREGKTIDVRDKKEYKRSFLACVGLSRLHGEEPLVYLSDSEGGWE